MKTRLVCWLLINTVVLSGNTVWAQCNDPQPGVNSIKATSVNIEWDSWHFANGTTFEIGWRVYGSAGNWEVRTGLTGNQYSVTGLATNTTYEYRVRAFCTGGVTSGYGVSVFATVCEIPQIVDQNAFSTGAVLAWNSINPVEVQWQPEGGVWSNPVNTTAQSLTVTGLQTNTRYNWHVRGVCGVGVTSDYTNPLTFLTQCQLPYNLYEQIYPTKIGVSGYSDEVGATYAVDWQPQSNPTGWTPQASVTTPAFLITGLTPATNYTYRLRTTCANGSLSTYYTNTSRTGDCLVPVSLFSTSITGSAAVLSWYDRYSNTIPVDIRYRVSGTTDWLPVSSATASYTLTGLAGSTTYEWQVRAACATGYESAWTSSSTFTTLAASNCATPTSLTTTDITRSAARYSWADMVPGNAETYNLRLRQVGTTTWRTITGITVTTYLPSGQNLTPNTSYEWQVQTVCSTNNFSAWSVLTSFTTPLCEAVIDPESIVYIDGKVLLTWGLPNGSAGGFSYTVRYRLANTADAWTMLEWINGPSYQVSNLLENRLYEWQVRLNCSGVTFSDYTPLQTFIIGGCMAPPYPQVFGGGFSNGAAFAQIRYGHNFSITDNNTKFNIRWRVVGATSWQTVIDFSSQTRIHELGNLAINTAYEWQIQTVCSNGQLSPYSSLIVFSTSTTAGCFPAGAQYTVKNGSWTDYSVWSCGTVPGLTASIYPAGSPIEIRHAVTLPSNTTGWAKLLRYTAAGRLTLGTNTQIRNSVD